MTSSSASSIRIGSYHLGARIGEGGAGEVYRAEGPQGAVAIHLLGSEPSVSGADRARVGHEIAARARVQHPSLIRVIDHGVDQQRGRYLVTPQLVGPSLRDKLDGRRVDPEEAIRLAAPIAAAVAALHAAGLVHGALTPERVTATPAGAIVVHDLGPSWRDRHTADTAAADVWAIGAMIHAWVAGQRVARETPVGAALSALVASCLAADPARRPTVAALAARLEALLDERPVAGRAGVSGAPDVEAAPAIAPRRRRWLRAALVAAAAGAVVAGAAYALTRDGPARAPAASPLADLPAIRLDQLPVAAAPFDLPSAPAGEPLVDPAVLAGRRADDAIVGADARAAAHPGDRDAALGRAMIYLAAGHERRGLELLDEALRRHPDHAPGWSSKAYVEVRRGRWDAAEQAFARALLLDPGDGAALRNRGIARHRRGQVRDAYRDLRAALALDPTDVEAISELIQLYARLDRGDDTRALLERAARLRPDRPQVWLDLSQTQPPAEALRSVRRALAIDPNSARGHQRLCDVLTGLHDPGAAVACAGAAAP